MIWIETINRSADACRSSPKETISMPAAPRSTAPRTWSVLERRLWKAFRSGEWFDVPAQPGEGAVAPGIRSSVIRHLLLTPPAPADGHMLQMRVRGARIGNGLDLAGGDVGIPIFFEDCVFDTVPASTTP
jgi:hypothetical protein